MTWYSIDVGEHEKARNSNKGEPKMIRLGMTVDSSGEEKLFNHQFQLLIDYL